jgi:hypothetical protein
MIILAEIIHFNRKFLRSPMQRQILIIFLLLLKVPHFHRDRLTAINPYMKYIEVN